MILASLVLLLAPSQSSAAQPLAGDFVVQGEPQTVVRAFVFSLNNDNSRYQTVVYTQGAQLSPGDDKAYFELGSGRVIFHGSSTNPDAGWTRYLTTTEPAQAASLAKALGVELASRTHPGHDLRARADVAGPIDVVSETIPLRFHLRNAHDAAISFMDGGRNRNASGRDNRFTVTVLKDGTPLPDPGNKWDRGGLGYYREITPGAEYALEIDLRDYCDFPGAGEYEIELAYSLDLRHGEGRAGAAFREPWNHLAWDDEVRASLRLVVEPIEPPVLEIDGAQVPVLEAYVISRNNANSEFDLRLRLDLGPDEAGPRHVQLAVGDRSYTAVGLGYDGERADCSFRVTRAEAPGLAGAFGVPVQRRVHSGHRLRARFEPPTGPVGANPSTIPVVFVIENVGTVAVEYLDGGRSRNASGRDNRFTFRIRNADLSIKPIEVYDFGGLAVHYVLKPGETHRLDVDLVHWCDFDKSGSYSLEATFDFDVYPVGNWADRRPWLPRAHHRWAQQLQASVQVVVE